MSTKRVGPGVFNQVLVLGHVLLVLRFQVVAVSGVSSAGPVEQRQPSPTAAALCLFNKRRLRWNL